MKPQRNILIDRVQGDTVPVVLHCQIKSTDGTSNVADSATVRLNIAAVPVISITGVSAGSGLFTIDPTSFTDQPAGRYGIEVEVNDGTIKTIGKGTLILEAEIA